MHPAFIFYKISKFISRKICYSNWFVIMAMICLTATNPAIAKMANRCDEPVFGAVSIAIDKVVVVCKDVLTHVLRDEPEALVPAKGFNGAHHLAGRRRRLARPWSSLHIKGFAFDAATAE